MKKNLPLFLVFVAVLMTACGGKTEKVVEALAAPAPLVPEIPIEEQLANKIEEELASGVQKDTLILGFKFGMSKRDVYRHSKRLYSKKKMFKVKNKRGNMEYVYNLRLPKSGKLTTYFEGFYYKNRLYKTECLPKIPKDLDMADVLEETLTFYEQKYGRYDFKLPVEGVDGCHEYLWIEGNRRIELYCNDRRLVIHYIDIPKSRLAAKDMDI